MGKNFKTWLLKFLQYANLLHIKPSYHWAYLLTQLDQPTYKAVELLKLSELLTFEEFAAKLVDRFDLGKTKGDFIIVVSSRRGR